MTDYERQLNEAARILADKGRAALDNPHGAIGRMCKCGACFCCAAAKIVKTYDQAAAQLRKRAL